MVGLKLNLQKKTIMASGPITSWEIDGETVETVSHFTLGCMSLASLYLCKNLPILFCPAFLKYN